MYKLLIVDDEDFEREGMAQLINWKKYEIEMVGTAWNGVDAFQKTKELRPDIILTDIKMPVMNGIELIKKVREVYPDIEFAVLSGYGEYEFTSKAMEQGVRHYILKPCDEDKVTEVISKVKKDVDAVRKLKRREEEYQKHVMPKARQQFFRNLLLNREKVNVDRLFEGGMQDRKMPDQIRLLAFRSEESFDGVEEFVLDNMLGELLENQNMKVFISTVVRNDAVFVISDVLPGKIVSSVCRVLWEFGKIRKESIRAALSNAGYAGSLSQLYQQAEELFRIGEEVKSEPLLHYGMFEGKKQDMELLVDFAIVGKTHNYAELLQSLQITFLRMQKREFSDVEKIKIMDWVLRLLYQEGLNDDEILQADNVKNGQALLVAVAKQIYGHQAGAEAGSKESLRYQKALEEIYLHFQDQKFCLHDLATEIFYINEDYFGRLFQKMSGKKFTKFLLEARISAAEQLMRLEPDIMVYMVSEMVGYAPDGQYFSRIFKKNTGMTPSEYREKLR